MPLSFSIQIYEILLPELPRILSEISFEEIEKRQKKISKIYRQYFESTTKMTLRMLEILETGLIPGTIKMIDDNKQCVSNQAVSLVCINKCEWNQLIFILENEVF